ncbi:MAG: TatD family hydrolase [Planctomycetota bacterium]
MTDLRFFDPHAHMTSRTTDDYERMAAAGVRALIEPAFWLGQPRTNVGSFIDYFSSLVGWERFRASQFGITHYCAIGLNSKEANDEGLAKEVLEILPRFALKEGVVAIGEIGYDEITPAEEKAYQWQLQFAKDHDMVVMVHSPHRDKKRGILRSLHVAQEVGIDMEKLVIDHNNEETVEDVLDAGAWAAFTIYPHTKMGSQRMVELTKKYGPERFIVDSSCDWGVSDPLSVPKTAKLMLDQGLDMEAVERATFGNAAKAYGYSGQIDLEALGRAPVIDQRQLYNDNSVLRGQPARVDEGVPN